MTEITVQDALEALQTAAMVPHPPLQLEPTKDYKAIIRDTEAAAYVGEIVWDRNIALMERVLALYNAAPAVAARLAVLEKALAEAQATVERFRRHIAANDHYYDGGTADQEDLVRCQGCSVHYAVGDVKHAIHDADCTVAEAMRAPRLPQYAAPCLPLWDMVRKQPHPRCLPACTVRSTQEGAFMGAPFGTLDGVEHAPECPNR